MFKNVRIIKKTWKLCNAAHKNFVLFFCKSFDNDFFPDKSEEVVSNSKTKYIQYFGKYIQYSIF